MKVKLIFIACLIASAFIFKVDARRKVMKCRPVSSEKRGNDFENESTPRDGNVGSGLTDQSSSEGNIEITTQQPTPADNPTSTDSPETSTTTQGESDSSTQPTSDQPQEENTISSDNPESSTTQGENDPSDTPTDGNSDGTTQQSPPAQDIPTSTDNPESSSTTQGESSLPPPENDNESPVQTSPPDISETPVDEYFYDENSDNDETSALLDVENENCPFNIRVKKIIECQNQELFFDEETCNCIDPAADTHIHCEDDPLAQLISNNEPIECAGKTKIALSVACAELQGNFDELTCKCEV